MKKCGTVAVLLILLFSLPIVAFCSDSISEQGPRVFIGNNEINFITNGPIIFNNRTLVPMRALFEALDYQVAWQADGQRIIAINGGNIIVMQIGNKTIDISGTSYVSDVSPMIYNNKTYIPVRSLAECLGLKVDWDPYNNIVKIIVN